MKFYPESFLRLIVLSTSLFLISVNSHVFADQLLLENEPIFLSNAVAPNLVITVDDGPSMALGFFPDSVAPYSGRAAAKSVAFNRLAYDPRITYQPGLKSNGDSHPDAIFSAAILNISPNQEMADFYTGLRSTVNLSRNYRQPWNLLKFDDSSTFFIRDTSKLVFAPEQGDSRLGQGQAAYYYQHEHTRPNCDVNDLRDDDCYEKVIVPDDASQQQNFANWYQYHSLRYLRGKTLLSQTLLDLPPDVRVAWQTTSSAAISSGEGQAYVQAFNTALRTEFYTWLNGIAPADTMTSPVRESMVRAGEFFSRRAADNAYRVKPGGTSTGDKDELSCRGNYHLLLSAGSYDENPISADIDGDQLDKTLPDGKLYDWDSHHQKIYTGEGTDTLADIAFHYWSSDLRIDLADTVAFYLEDIGKTLSGLADEDYWLPENDVATWQHMVNFTLGFGPGFYDASNSDDREKLLTGESSWLSPFVGSTLDRRQAKNDDLWHAAINSRGKYFSVLEADDLDDSLWVFPSILERRESSAANLSATSGELSSDSALFQVGFNSLDWSGYLRRFPLSSGLGASDDNCHSQPAGQLCAMNAQVLSSSVEPWNTRHIFTSSPAADGSGLRGLALQGGAWADLSPGQQALLSAERLDYILGDTRQEQRNRGNLRNRTDAQRTLGAVVHASPLIVGNGLRADGAYQRYYPDRLSSEGYSYQDFLASIKTRPDMLYVSANDGLLHAYSYEASTSHLHEEFSYLPEALLAKLSAYSDPNYSYKGLLDGYLQEGDVFYENAWHTVLVSAFRQGAKGLFALDITRPEAFSAGNVLWEFSDNSAGSNDLGHIYGRSPIVKTHEGSESAWAVILGNGYNSVNGNAVLLVLDVKSGETIASISTGVGVNPDSPPAGAKFNAAIDNGLSAPFPVDVDADFIVDYAYAGDLYGNLWRFDLRNSNAAHWTASLIFTTEDGQPITGQPRVGRHPFGEGVMVYFGTGKYLEPSDDTTEPEAGQSIYAVWDRLKASPVVVTPEHLLAQRILRDSSNFQGDDARLVSDYTMRYFQGVGVPEKVEDEGYLGWYLNLYTKDAYKWERVISQPMLRSNVLSIVSMTPQEDQCAAGGKSWLMALDAFSGGRLSFQAFDTNNDGTIDEADQLKSNGESINTSGWRSKTMGLMSGPVVVHDRSTNTDNLAVTGSSGNIAVLKMKGNAGLMGRRAWRRLR